MGIRIKRTALALVIVVVAYVAYALIAVPLIEPSVVLATSRGPSVAAPPRTQSFAGLFPPGSWELDRPKILETEQGTLLFDDYEPLEDRRKMRLNRCTFIRFLPTSRHGSGTGDGAAGKGRPLILKATSGAVLEFNRPLDVARGEFGDLEGGQLAGDIIITSPPTAPDQDDAIRFTTRNVQIDRQRIWTPHEVDFQYGPHRGRGRDLRIEWSKAAAAPKGSGASKSSLRGVRSLEIARLERLELQMREGDSFGGLASLTATARKDAATTPGKPASGTGSTPVRVSCRGPCRFDVLQQVASLNDQVSVVRDNLEGPSDQLQSELLEIHFAEVADAAAKDQAAASPTLRPIRLVATGYPATIRVPSRGIDVQARHIEYDLEQRRVRLEDEERVLVSDPQYRVEARQLEYEAGPPGRLGRLWALGPGHLWGRGTVQGRDVEATWNQEVHLRPHENNVVLSLVGGGEVSVAETAHFLADEMHLFLLEELKPGTEHEYSVLPDRMRAVGNVALDSPQLSAAVREANVWFRTPTEPSAAPARDEPATLPANGAAGTASGGAKEEGAAVSKFDLVADLLHAQVILGQPAQLERLTVRGGLRLRQIEGAAETPLVVEGSDFELQDGHTPQAQAVLSGQPATVASGPMQISGPEFRLDRATNTLEIPGAGRMTVPPRQTAGAALPPLDVVWQGNMRFDGRTARFAQQVRVQGGAQLRNQDQLKFAGFGESFHATLTEVVDFVHLRAKQPIGVRELGFDEAFDLETEVLDPSGERKAMQKMNARNLTVDQITGDLHADGPGWVSSVHQRGNWSPTATAAPPTARPGSRIEYLKVRFSREVVGRMHDGQLEFLDRTRSIYGPVAAWDQTLDDQQPLGPADETVLLTCDRLAVADMSDRPGGLEKLELEATGNALVRGSSFSASGQRISYVRAKDQLVLEGDGRNDAILEYQPQIGAPPAELKGGKILFWPGTRQFELNDVRSLDVHDLQQLRLPRRP